MKLLIITQKVDINDDVLGFFHGWIIEFSKKFKKVTVICLKQGDYNFPSNVEVMSLGKEMGRTKLGYLFSFYKYIWKERHNYDTVFVHMNPQYVILGWPIWKILGKKVSLWYAAGRMPLIISLANKLTDIVFTSTPEGYRLKSRKIQVVGQGIDANKFEIQNPKIKTDGFKIVSVGRISPSKDYKTLILALNYMKLDGFRLPKVEIAGQPATNSDIGYMVGLKKLVEEKDLLDIVKFIGPIPNKELPNFLNMADIFVNMSHTGSLDKAILEAMACGLPVLTCNEALRGVLGPYANELMYSKEDYVKLADGLGELILMANEEREKLGLALREIVVKDHNLVGLISKISHALGAVTDTNDFGEIYNQKVRQDDGQYERQRWFKNPIARVGYEMIAWTIKHHLIENGLKFKNCLEVGPGPGTWTKLLLKNNPEAGYDLVDISSEMLNLAKQNIGDIPNVKYFLNDFMEFSSDKKYDLFFSSRAIEYFGDKKGAIKKIYELMRSGGLGLIITKTPHYIRARIIGRKVYNIHLGQIHPSDMKSVLTESGFKNIEIYMATATFPILRGSFLNRLVFLVFRNIKLNPIGQFFAESYVVKFQKP